MSRKASQFSINRRTFAASGASLILAGMTEHAFAAFQDPAITFERVEFPVEGLPVKGVLVRPKAERSFGAVVTCGPWTCVKEQAPSFPLRHWPRQPGARQQDRENTNFC